MSLEITCRHHSPSVVPEGDITVHSEVIVSTLRVNGEKFVQRSPLDPNDPYGVLPALAAHIKRMQVMSEQIHAMTRHEAAAFKRAMDHLEGLAEDHERGVISDDQYAEMKAASEGARDRMLEAGQERVDHIVAAAKRHTTPHAA